MEKGAREKLFLSLENLQSNNHSMLANILEITRDVRGKLIGYSTESEPQPSGPPADGIVHHLIEREDKKRILINEILRHLQALDSEIHPPSPSLGKGR